ncbi:hypothetical protein GQ44DRAFT_707236, partial [Phaeosphaeriaceae sp. PMI808]
MSSLPSPCQDQVHLFDHQRPAVLLHPQSNADSPPPPFRSAFANLLHLLWRNAITMPNLIQPRPVLARLVPGIPKHIPLNSKPPAKSDHCTCWKAHASQSWLRKDCQLYHLVVVPHEPHLQRTQMPSMNLLWSHRIFNL